MEAGYRPSSGSCHPVNRSWVKLASLGKIVVAVHGSAVHPFQLGRPILFAGSNR
jgi:hypothetical protein